MFRHSPAMSAASPWVPEALARMAAVPPAISSRAAESWPVTPERLRMLSPEVRVRSRTSPTTPLMRSALFCRVPMASRMGAMTYFRMMRKAAATRRMPSTRVTVLVIREVTYTAESRPRASAARALTAV